MMDTTIEFVYVTKVAHNMGDFKAIRRYSSEADIEFLF